MLSTYSLLWAEKHSEFGSHSTMKKILFSPVFSTEGWLQNCHLCGQGQSLAHCVAGGGCPAIPLNFESLLMIMESRSGETSHLQRMWASNSLLVNIRLSQER